MPLTSALLSPDAGIAASGKERANITRTRQALRGTSSSSARALAAPYPPTLSARPRAGRISNYCWKNNDCCRRVLYATTTPCARREALRRRTAGQPLWYRLWLGAGVKNISYPAQRVDSAAFSFRHTVTPVHSAANLFSLRPSRGSRRGLQLREDEKGSICHTAAHIIPELYGCRHRLVSPTCSRTYRRTSHADSNAFLRRHGEGARCACLTRRISVGRLARHAINKQALFSPLNQEASNHL